MVTGKIVGGRVVIEGEPFKEGSTVTVLAPDSDETLELSPEDEAELSRRLAEVRKGNFVDGDELLRELGIQE